MSESLVSQIITAIVTLGVALIGYLKLKAGQKTVESKVDTYHKEVDGMKTELVEAVRGRADAEGQLTGAAAAKAEMVVQIPPKVEVSITEKDAQKVAETIVETVKADPEIEVKKLTDNKIKYHAKL